MANVINTIKLALDSYDKKRVTYIREYNKINNIKLHLQYNDINANNIELFAKGNKIYNGNFEIISVIRNDLNIWNWGWGLSLPKSFVKKVRALHDYGINKLDDNNNILIMELRDYLINNVIHIESDLKKDILLAITSYLTKSNTIIEIKLDEESYTKFRQNIDNKIENIDLDTTKKTNDITYSIYITI